MQKLYFNLVYPNHIGVPKIVYESSSATIIRTKRPHPRKINIGIGAAAIRKPQREDSLLILEPYCIRKADYLQTSKYKHVFGWCKPALENVKNSIIINHPSWDDPPPFETLNRPPWKERNGIVIISNNKKTAHPSGIYELRWMLADYLHENGFDVSWYGQMPIDRPYYKGPLKDKLSQVRKAKFCICPENCYDEKYSWGYFSEKMPEVWFGGAVPLYMGCYNIDDFNFAKESYIDLREYVTKNKSIEVKLKKLADTLNSYREKDYIKMIQSVNENMKLKNGLYDVISNVKAYEKIIEMYQK